MSAHDVAWMRIGEWAGRAAEREEARMAAPGRRAGERRRMVFGSMVWQMVKISCLKYNRVQASR